VSVITDRIDPGWIGYRGCLAGSSLTVMSRCSRFLSVFFPGTTWNQIPRAPPGRIDNAVQAEAELVLAHADGAPVVVPVVIAIRRWLEFVPSAATQNRATGSGSAQSITS
jgi:hypothetical protein